MIKRNKIPTILGIFLLLVATFAGVFYLNTKQIFRIGASPTNQPKDIRIGSISDNSATISWITDSKTFNFLSWGESQGNVSRIENETEGKEKFFTHSISLSGLKPSTTYYFKINSEGNEYDNNGVPWKFTTGATLSQNSVNQVISGSVINASGLPVARAIVYITIQGYLASTLTSETGNFVYQLGNTRTPDLKNYAQIDSKETLIQISVVSPPEGVSSAQIFPASANPIPPIILGQVYDFRNNEPNISGQAPSANLALPEDNIQESKFNIISEPVSSQSKTVILESLDEGEVVTSTQPEFFGKGPAGETITVTVNSDKQITSNVTIAQNGSWSYAVPENLSPGVHSVTITWKDISGITRSLTRNFVVQASELPAFEATPSQTLAPTASPTVTPMATATPTATTRPTTTPTPTPAPSLPDSGLSWPTIAATLFGILIIIGSLIFAL